MPYGTWFPGQNAAPAGPGGVRVFNENVIVNGWIQSQRGFSTVNLPTVTTPGTIASASTIYNTTGYDCIVYASATGGIGTGVSIGGVQFTQGTYAANVLSNWYVNNGQSLSFTYSGTLTWRWIPV